MSDPRIERLRVLVLDALKPPAGIWRIAFSLVLGGLCHALFALAVLSMIVAMFFGMSRSFGTVPYPWAILTNAVLLIQFPLAHSWLLTGPGGRFLANLFPGENGKTLVTTSYTIVASLQLIALFGLWTPSGIVWWQAEGAVLWLICTAYALSLFMLIKASFDAGLEVQSGALGWMSLMAGKRPIYPDMPTLGLFRVLRHPIYLAFALALWAVPTWTPDQLVLAITYTGYCVIAPIWKEQRFERRYGTRFEAYRKRVPYMLPRLKRPASSRSDVAPVDNMTP